MIKPLKLKKGDTIGVVAPASPMDVNRANAAKKYLEYMGFKVVMGRSCYERYGYLAGNDFIRARDINLMFEDKGIDAIICLRGGYGSIRILPLIDYDIIKCNPKIFVGYSDITTIHIAINNICDMITFHGPMIGDMVNIDDFSRDSFEESVMKNLDNRIIKNPDDREMKFIYEGECKGRITGGNLCLITSTIGTPYEIDTRNKILFIEEVDEFPYRIDRMLNQLSLSGKLNDARGIILGNFKDCYGGTKNNSLTLNNIFKDLLLPLKKPILTNIEAGHCIKKITIPLGVMASINSFDNVFKILESGVS